MRLPGRRGRFWLLTALWASLVASCVLIAQDGLQAMELVVTALAGVGHPALFAETATSARVLLIAAIGAGLALRVYLFAALTVWLLERRVHLRAGPADLADRRHSHASWQQPADEKWTEVSRN